MHCAAHSRFFLCKYNFRLLLPSRRATYEDTTHCNERFTILSWQCDILEGHSAGGAIQCTLALPTCKVRNERWNLGLILVYKPATNRASIDYGTDRKTNFETTSNQYTRAVSGSMSGVADEDAKFRIEV